MLDKTRLTWNEALITGNNEIDEQHRELFSRVEESVRAVNEGARRPEVARALGFLRGYVMKHFRDEEKLQREANFPEYPAHKKEHELFERQLQDLSKRFTHEGLTDGFAKDFEHLLGSWLVNHILVKDVALSQYLKAS